MLVSKGMFYNEDSWAISSHYKSVSEKKSGNQNCDKLYEALLGKGKQKFKQKTTNMKETNGVDTFVALRCFKCGGTSRRANECKSTRQKCFKCEKQGHYIV